VFDYQKKERMADIKTKYMGLELANPIIAGASRLTADLQTISNIEAAGAGAVVCASLFEEQIQLEQMLLEETMEEMNYRDSEMARLFLPEVKHAGAKEHQMWLRETKKAVTIPVIASLNAVHQEKWLDYSRQLEDTGVDGLELNFFHTPENTERCGEDIEKERLEILHEIKETVAIPVAAKLSFFYTNPLQVIAEMDREGVDAFILFNRLFENDIDVQNEVHISPFNLSREGDYKLPLRYIGMLFGKVKASLCANTGILRGEDMVRAILAGADAVYVVSTLYLHREGVQYIQRLQQDLRDWMEAKGYKQLKDFQGKLSQKNIRDPFVYQRAQYVELLLHSEKLLSPHSP
jgi:dihydroorotate dehydrogenase (fumarate)